MKAGNILGQLLSKNPKIDSPSFWESLDKYCTEGPYQETKLSMKAKQNLSAAIKYACSTIDKNTYSDIVIKWLNTIIDNSAILSNFGEKEYAFYQTVTAFSTTVLDKEPSQVNTKRQLDLIATLFHLIDEFPIFHDQIGEEVATLCINMILKRSEEVELVNRCLSLLFIVIDNDNVRKSLSDKTEEFSKLISTSHYPRLQLQFLELFFRIQTSISGFDCTTTDTQNFNESSHQCLLKVNGASKEPIFNIKFNSLANSNKKEFGNGWLDIGFDDMIICFNDSVITIKFDDIDGLDSSDGNLSVTDAEGIPQLEVPAGGQFTIIPDIKIEPPQMEQIFSRISYGESVSNSQNPQLESNIPIPPPQPVQEQHPRSSVAPPEMVNKEETIQKPNKVRSSIAMFVPDKEREQQQTVQLEDTNDLFEDNFSDNDSIAKSVDSNIIPPQQQIEQKIESIIEEEEDEDDSTYQPPVESIPSPVEESSESQEYEPSPPLLEINIGQSLVAEKSSKTQEETAKNDSPPSSPKQLMPSVTDNNVFGELPMNVSNCLEGGLKSLSLTTLEHVKVFSELLKRHVDRFRDDMTAKIRERETGSVKQLETSKSNFQDNILVFKRKEASIHQSLNGFEDKTREISAQLTSLQKSMRQNISSHRKALEAKLAMLRKQARNDTSDDEASEALDSQETESEF
ncbi:hypothetical protein TVAG_365460 [Trichomonas vaginalis G3]|uniref:Uncharacterized protein n=1 Tax=Trichomonas vaginalis (strain ATCC PRA-98 / G3) TaxID=412133 RepID=A2DHJ0_TRIV3|nr:hypothetical protein TVAGG3_0302170 [Trichomonas vaginalis G3]EAY20038.1 hypothetical protein TVAG_365460 [Trichomonas vaginalis G3]KAI5527977.1 hypothetical protein TVAGG3_0302170 [Trichomonas vaginalis G3]|eukprot:XP_001581024.1 hypothetical protein [Trichomonas vaginalis G3]